MLKPLVFYAAVMGILVVAMLASRRSKPQFVKHRSVHAQRLTTDDTE